MKVRVKLTQVVDGHQYKGEISFGERFYRYKARFLVPIDKLIIEGTGKSAEVLLTYFEFKLEDGTTEHLVSDEFKLLFIRFVGGVAVDFYEDPQTEDSRARGILGTSKLSSEVGSILGVDLSIEVGTETTYEVSNDDEMIANFLSAHQF